MFTLEQKIFIVQCYFSNGERLENGEWSYSTPRLFEEFQQKFPDFQDTYQQFALIILFFHTRKQRVQKEAWHNSRINATDNCNLIDVPTMGRSFENMKRREQHNVSNLIVSLH
jgi:hypothetical protein